MPIPNELLHAIQQLFACREPGAVLASLAAAVRALTGADGAAVMLREGDHCRCAAEHAVAPLWLGRRFPLGASIAGWSILNRRQVAIADIYDDPRAAHAACRTTFVDSVIMTPIRTPDPLGAVGAYWAGNHAAHEGELRILQHLANAAATAIGNAEQVDALTQANRRKDEFLSLLVHAMQEPLAPVASALERGPDTESAAGGRPPGRLERETESLVRRLNDVLEFAGVLTTDVALREERVDFARLVRTTADAHSEVLQTAGIVLERELPDTPLWVIGDPARLVQIVRSLLEDARRSAPAGSAVALRLTGDTRARRAILAVGGTGVASDAHARQPQAAVAEGDAPVRPRLALALAKRLTEIHGGSIETQQTEPGRAAQHVAQLPCEPEFPAVVVVSEPAEPPARRLRVLVIEDNPDSADSLRLLLERCGHGVTIASSGPEGLRAARALHPDVVVCDIGLPGMSGLAIAEAMRSNPETAAARLIALTGYGRDEDAHRARRAGFDAHLVKPVDAGRLVGQLAQASARQ